MEKTAYLILQNGKVFAGERFGADRDAGGEIVFNTSLTGYSEILTDPSYCGQIVVQTFPLIGNYGVIPEDFESARPWLSAYVVREWCDFPSNFRSAGTVDAYLKRHGVPGICGVDTRELTRIIRSCGVMNACLTEKLPAHLDDFTERLSAYKVCNVVKQVSGASPLPCGGRGPRVALWDFGAKANIARELLRRGAEVVPVPYDATAKYILSLAPAGIVLSNGPGDPAENTGVIREVRALMGRRIPMFGICLGHQLMALAAGGKTEKLRFGHRGANHPAKDAFSGRVYLTSQNHGYAVRADSPGSGAKVSFVNANDGTVEGIDYGAEAFSVQFHPEAASGPRDTSFLFDRFFQMLKGNGGKVICR